MNRKLFVLIVGIIVFFGFQIVFGQNQQTLNIIPKETPLNLSGIITLKGEINGFPGYTGNFQMVDPTQLTRKMPVRIYALNASGTTYLYGSHAWDKENVTCKLKDLPKTAIIMADPVTIEDYRWFFVQVEGCQGWVVQQYGPTTILEPYRAEEILATALAQESVPTATCTATPTPTATPTMTATSTPTINVRDAKVNTDGRKLNLRSGPNSTYKVLAQLAVNSIITVFPDTETRGWVEVLALGHDGWVFREYLIYLDTTPEPTPTPEYP